MRINILLEELISIAKTSKTDFALSMNMTPSGLSKILAGKRIPVFKERRQFTRQTATYFSEVIYSPGCYLKFTNIFPVIYDFKSVDELRAFLTCAIEYALDNDFLLDNNMNLSYTERGMFFWTDKNVLNILCVTLSDYILKDNGTPLEYFGSLPLHNPVYASIFQRIRVNISGKHQITLNYLLSSATFESKYQAGDQDMLSFIMRTQRYCDLNFWELDSPIEQPFLLLKGQMLLLFTTQIDDTPLIIPIYHKGYLTVFYGSLLKKGLSKISYSKEEAVAYLQENPQWITKLLDKGIDHAYNFVSIGYLLEKSELKSLKSDSSLHASVFSLLRGILTGNTSFTVSIATMERFVATGRAVVPLLGIVHLPSEDRIPYLQRFNAYLYPSNDHGFDKIKIIKSELSNFVLLCSKDSVLIYTVDDKYQTEKLHFFRNDRIAELLCGEILSSHKQTINFSPELWGAYQEQLLTADAL